MTRWLFFGMVLATVFSASTALSFHNKSGDTQPHYYGYPVIDAKGRCWVQQVMRTPSGLLSILPPEQYKGSRVFCLRPWRTP